MANSDQSKGAKDLGLGVTSADDLSVTLKGYETLNLQILHEGEASIARSRLYLAVNAALAALAGFGGAVSLPLAYASAGLAAICNLLWAATNARSNTYISLWFLELRRLEHMLPPLRAYQSGYKVFRGEEVRGLDGHPVSLSRWARTLPVKSGYSLLAVVMLGVWLGLAALLATGVVTFSPQPVAGASVRRVESQPIEQSYAESLHSQVGIGQTLPGTGNAAETAGARGRGTWADPATIVSLISFLGSFLVSFALLLAYRKTNRLQEDLRDWRTSQTSPQLRTGTFSLLRFIDGPTLRLQGVLLNPGSTTIQLTHGMMRFEDKPQLECPVVFRGREPKEAMVPGYGYLWLDRDFYIQHVSIRDQNYWPKTVSISIGYVAGGEAKELVRQLHRSKVVGDLGWYVEEPELTSDSSLP